MSQGLSKKEKRELRRVEWQTNQDKAKKNAQVKKYFIWGGAIILFAGLLFLLIKIVGTTQSTALTANLPPVSASDITFGSPSAKLVIIEYSDFQCPACASYYPILKKIKEDYKDNLLFVYRNFPLRGVHKNALISAQAGYAALKQGKFWEFHDILFDNQRSWSELSDPRETYISYAKKLGLDTQKFAKDLESDETKKFVISQENQALSVGINSTPTIFLNTKRLDLAVSYAEFKKAIEKELSKNSP